VTLDDLLLDLNNPRFARSLDVQGAVLDRDMARRQEEVVALFVNEPSKGNTDDEDDSGTERDQISIEDLVTSISHIGFVPIDRIVVRLLEGGSKRKPKYVVIEGNRRVAAAKFLKSDKMREEMRAKSPEEKRQHEEILKTLERLDVLLLDTAGLDENAIHEQIGVILGLRHFGSVMQWGPLAKAINIFQEYMGLLGPSEPFVFKPKLITAIQARLSLARSDVTNALKTYRAFQQLQDAFPQAPPKPTHYSLIQECVRNPKLSSAGFINQSPSTYELAADSLENLNTICEFGRRDSMADKEKILQEPKSVQAFGTLVADAANHKEAAVRQFATNLRDEVIHKVRSLEDAAANLKSFKIERRWTEALEDLLKKVVVPGAPAGTQDGKRLEPKDLSPKGNDQIKLSDARAAFKNVRIILNV
jgi:hypothetical protein